MNDIKLILHSELIQIMNKSKSQEKIIDAYLMPIFNKLQKELSSKLLSRIKSNHYIKYEMIVHIQKVDKDFK